jgi:hypothetical protein
LAAARFALALGAGTAFAGGARAGTEFIARLRPAVTTFVAEAALGMFVTEFETASWIDSMGVLTVLSIDAFVSGPPIINMTDEMIKTKDKANTTQGV